VSGRIRAWARRAAALQRELEAVAEIDRRYWLLSGGVALAEARAKPELYLASDAEPDADTFMAYRAPRPGDVVGDAITRARAARTALRELDGELPDQPLAVTVDRASATTTRPNDLEVAAFAIGDACLVAHLDDPELAAKLAAVLAGASAPRTTLAPFVCVAIGDEPIETARHGHRRAWTATGGPWLGLGRTGELATVTTCHLVVDGYGHARIAARIAELVAGASTTSSMASVPALRAVPGAIPLAVVSRDLAQPPRVIPLAYAAGGLLHRDAGRPAAPFSPTIQIPVARGAKDDPVRLRRRVVSATTSVRFDGGVAEPFEVFEARVRETIAREAAASGLVSRLLAAARGVPVPVAWKRRSIGATRPRWLEGFAAIIGGRALISRISMDVPIPSMCAVSSPSRVASQDDPAGGCVITIVDDGVRGTITLCGSGATGTPARASAFLDELLGAV